MSTLDSLLDILRCPDNGETLTVADAATTEKLNDKIDKRQLLDRAGKAITLKVDSALIRKDARYAYAVRDGIPQMIVDEAIPLDQIPG